MMFAPSPRSTPSAGSVVAEWVRRVAYILDKTEENKMTARKLDAILYAYFEGRLSSDQKEQFSMYVEEDRDRAYADFCGLVVSEDVIPDY
jgi:hypothetical protein